LLLEYALQGRSLAMTLRVENPGDRPLPFGLGTHPYFRMPASTSSGLERCRIDLPARLRVALKDCLPTGSTTSVTPENDLRSGVVIGARALDDVYTGLAEDPDGRIRATLIDEAANRRIEQTFGRNLAYAVAYIPPHRQAVCIEPYSCVTNAINLGDKLGAEGPPTGWMEIRPGSCEIFETTITATEWKPM
jgi:aldose 1-epimerase